ncbi:TPR domain protein [Penicillium sp. IBT 16267x]|nr:TPR domain protein [Penicillium sp. IBT 16267x]
MQDAKGLGMFAKVDIPRGTRVISEPALLDLQLDDDGGLGSKKILQAVQLPTPSEQESFLDVNLFPLPTTSAGKTFTITRTHTVYVPPTEAPSVRKRDDDIDLANLPIFSLISGLLDKLPIDASIKVLPGGLSDLTELSDINLLSIVTCILKNLGINL